MSLRTVVVFAMVTAFVGCGPKAYPVATRAFADAATAARIASALLNSQDVDGSRVDVRVVDGVATLEGEVPSVAERDRAVELVGTVEGVTRVESRLQAREAGTDPKASRPTAPARRRPTARF